ncbi:MAG TPA: sigma-70 family RNA polymerase sigma factor [Candidatus Binataceae bacterium]|nr:sigma-70 family RNA polymerase sigma factor [Candidatus Binataceae bacterium]
MGTQSKPPLPRLFEIAFKQLDREILRFLYRYTNSREDALDLFQETWLRAYRAYPTFKARPNAADGFRPWIFRIAANVCRNHARDAARRRRVIAPGGKGHPDRPEGAARGATHGVQSLKQKISQLPEKQGRALAMRKFEGMDYPEIAAALKCSLESARANVHQALKKLRSEK